MPINAATKEHVKSFEGLRLKAYPDPGSINGEPWTIGYGHTSDSFMAVYEGLTITKKQAEAALDHDLDEAGRAVDRLVTVPLTDNQFGALVSFAFNVGVGAFQKSTLLRLLNAGAYDAVPSELMRWINNDGKPMEGLKRRREAEAALFEAKGTTSPKPKRKPTLCGRISAWWKSRKSKGDKS